MEWSKKMISTDRKELIAWLESRYKDTPMPGAKRMFKLALDAVRELENDPKVCFGVDLASGHDFTAYGRPPERSAADGEK